MDIVPTSLAIAQAAKETGWGTSRFAIEGNALFGQWTWSDNGIKPAAGEGNHKVMRFNVLNASVRAYQRNLNTHSSYREFRKTRAIQRDNEGKLNSLELVQYLHEYAETGIEYTKILKEFDRFEIKILDGYGFKAEKYFDVTANNWELKDVGDAFQKMKNDCLEISKTENKVIT